MSSIPLDTQTLVSLHTITPESPLYSTLSESTIDAFAQVQPAQTTHRINIINSWGGSSHFQGQKILELGCGQGDASVVLAAAVSGGDGRGRVTAWDPASPDYGSPLTVKQAQTNILSKGSINPYLEFHLHEPLEPLLKQPYDTAILLHCIYYFPSPSALLITFKQLHAAPIQRLCLAEYALKASNMNQQPHVLAVLAEQALEVFKGGKGNGNVQCVLSPTEIKRIAGVAGWMVEKEEVITPGVELQDGRWEVGNVCSEGWSEEVDETLKKVDRDTEKEKGWLVAARDAVLEARQVLVDQQGKGWDGKVGSLVATTDVWCGSFVKE